MNWKLPATFFSILCQYVFSQGTWIQKASLPAVARQEAVGFSIGTQGYIGTGFNVNVGNGCLGDFYEWDQATDTWTARAGVTPRQGGDGGVSIGNKGYIRLEYDCSTPYRVEFGEWDKSTNTWAAKANFPPTPREDGTKFVIGTKAYYACGWRQGGIFYNELWEWNQATNIWTQKANFPGTGRWYPAGFSIGAKGYVGLGYDGSVYHNDFWEWDQATDTWSQKTNFPGNGRWSAVSFAIGTKGYVGTGKDASTIYKDFWEYDQVTDTWKQQTNFPGAARWLATGFSIGCKGYLGTGADGSTYYNDFWEFSPYELSVLSQSNVSCNGSSDGTATVSVNGGSSPFTYFWSPTGGTNVTATGLSAGTYTVTVTDAGTCGTATQTLTITQPPALTATISSTNVSCNGGNNGSATANLSGGTSPYSYSWSTTPIQTASTATGLSVGNYTVSVTESNGCITTQTIAITQPSALTSTVSSTNVSCNGANNGSALAAVSGGTLPYTYLWSNGQTTQNATGLVAGNYSLTVTDSSSCASTQTLTITQPTLLSSSVTVTNPNCNGGTGTAVANSIGGTSPYSYSWSNGQTTQSATGLIAGNYSVTISDSNGCMNTQTVSVTQPTQVTANIFSQANVLCNGGSNGSATITAGGGMPSYTYLWNPTGQTTSSATGLSAGNFTLTVTDANGCSQTTTVLITQPAAISLSINAAQTNCNANTGTAVPAVSGGTGSYSYNWSNGQTSQTATGLGAGNYSLIVTDANGCTKTQTLTVTTIAGPVATANAANVSVTLGATTQLTATGGGTYSWSPVTGLNCTTCSNPIASPTATTDYCVFVTDGNGCTDSACILISIEIPCGTLFLPNAFSPNDDGSNDQFCLRGWENCISKFSIIIYNRWGEKVFATTDPAECWDGKFYATHALKGTENTAVFVYYMEATDTNGEKIRKTGTISLVR